MIIRRVRKEDVPDIIRLVKKTFKQFVSPFYTKTAAKHYIDKIKIKAKELPTKERVAFVAIDGKKIVGVVDGKLDKTFGHTRWLYVDKQCHKRGIGKRLMQKVESIYKKKVKVAKLYASHYAIGFYQKIGYKKSRRLVKNKGGYTQPMKKVLRR